MKAILKGTAILLFFGALFAIGIGGAFAPDLLSDYETSRLTPTPANGSKIDSARCTNFMFIVSWCDVRYSGIGSVGASGEFRYLLAGGHSGAQIRLVQTNERPSRLASDFGIDHLPNRTTTLLVLLAIFVFAPLWPLLSVLSTLVRSRGRRAG